MNFVSEVTEKGVTESRFDLEVDGEVVPGIIWSPEGATTSRPVVLIGHGGTQHKRNEGVLSLGRRLVRHLGYAAVAIDAPDHGDRRNPNEPRLPREERLKQLRNMTPDQMRERYKRFGRAAHEWKATLDAVEKLDFVGDGPVGYWGVSMGTAIGVPFVASEPRIDCAVFGLAGAGARPPTNRSERMVEAAKKITIPILFLFQWDDEVAPRDAGLKLFDSFASKEKTMHVNPGGHLQMPPFERRAVEDFFRRHLGSAFPQAERLTA
ncbi:MAG: dienelactone hydrolase family protein [Acidimicrobiia bacterium]